MKRLRVVLCFAALSALPLPAAIQEPIKVEGGLVSGTPGWAWGVRQYRGIPFAAPPVGNRRWRPPQPVIPWTGVRAADEFSPACMQGGPAGRPNRFRPRPQAQKRGLPLSERVDSGSLGRRAAARDGVDPCRRRDHGIYGAPLV